MQTILRGQRIQSYTHQEDNFFLWQTAGPNLLLCKGYSARYIYRHKKTPKPISPKESWGSKHIHIFSYGGFIHFITCTDFFSIFFCFLTSAFLARLFQCLPNPLVSELSGCGKCNVPLVMKYTAAGLLGDDGKRQPPLTGAPVTSVEKRRRKEELFL